MIYSHDVLLKTAMQAAAVRIQKRARGMEARKQYEVRHNLTSLMYVCARGCMHLPSF